MNNSNNKRILLAGGGSGGPTAPLLAVAAELKKLDPTVEFLFVGTKHGPERKMVEGAGIRFMGMPAAKFRRYFSLSNFTDIFVFFYSLFVARRILKEFRPDMVFGAGSFVATPLSWMARTLGIEVGMHQQDIGIGLANRLISPFADLITAAFEQTAKGFYSGSGLGKDQLEPSAAWTGNPIRPEFFMPASDDAKKKLGLDDSLPILLVVGGATGAAQINEVVGECLEELVKSHQVIHITGPGKPASDFRHPSYHAFELLTHDMADAMKVADIVLSRAGISTIAELSALGKIAVLIPMPGTHQEDNAMYLKQKSAAVVLDSVEFNSEDLPRIITSLKFNVGRQKLLTNNIKQIMPHDAAARIAKLILSHVSAK